MKLSKKQFKMFISNRLDAKVNKYHNKKVKYDGYTFDSKKEGLFYLKLKTMQDLGQIKDLQLQVKFELQPSFKYDGKTIRAITYISDFVYYDIKENKIVVVDVKGFKTKDYLLKKKMFMYKYQDYVFKEIM